MPNYLRGKIYVLFSTRTPELYVGYTTATLENRLRTHIRESRTKLHVPMYQHFNETGMQHVYIECVEHFVCGYRHWIERRLDCWVRELRASLNAPSRIDNDALQRYYAWWCTYEKDADYVDRFKNYIADLQANLDAPEQPE